MFIFFSEIFTSFASVIDLNFLFFSSSVSTFFLTVSYSYFYIYIFSFSLLFDIFPTFPSLYFIFRFLLFSLFFTTGRQTTADEEHFRYRAFCLIFCFCVSLPAALLFRVITLLYTSHMQWLLLSAFAPQGGINENITRLYTYENE